jgi:UDP-glucuronate 4-epimerase
VPVTYADVTKLQDEFGYKPETTVAYGIREFVKWYRGYF